MRLATLSPLLLTLAAALPLGGDTGSKTPAPALPFIEDDYPKALAEARAKKLPIFVETWAPW